MPRFEDYHGFGDDPKRKKLHLDISAQLSRERKQRAYQQMGIGPGSWVLDVGCGVGVDTIPLAQIVGPMGKVVGIDIDESSIAEARRRAEEVGVSEWTEHRVADAADMPFEDNTFDACHSERLFMHLTNPDEILDEMIRVVKPGGRIAVIDPDGASISWDTEEAEIERRLIPVWNLLQENPYAGRQAFRLFKQHGLVDVVVDIVPSYSHDLEMARYITKTDDVIEKGLELGIVTQEEVDRFNASVERAAAMDAFFAYFCLITTIGRKP
ncbi:MAG: methyltransferase domain-containing protein [Anaerolineae bacterium]|nr:methyltransferase domain-containing protein [Anaerolineae bacterium]